MQQHTHTEEMAERTRSEVWLNYSRVDVDNTRYQKWNKSLACEGGNTSNVSKHLAKVLHIQTEECTGLDCLSSSSVAPSTTSSLWRCSLSTRWRCRWSARSLWFLCRTCSMNISEYESFPYLDYDYNDTCDQDGGPELPNGTTILHMLYYMLFFLSVLGNTTIFWVLIRYIKLKSMTDVCLLNLALSDLILAASLPLLVNYQNLATCKLLTGVYQVGFYSGNLFVTLMSVDRYLAIVHAVAAMRARTLRYGIIASITIWIISVIMAIPGLRFSALEIDPDDNSSVCQPFYPHESQHLWKMLRNFSENTVGLFVGLPVMIFCYVKILVVLSKSRNSKKDRAIKLIFTIVCVFVICWVPYNVVVLLKTLQLFLETLKTCQAEKAINSAMSYAELIALSHCCVNPIIYAFVGEKFRKSLRNALTRYFCWRQLSRGTLSHRDTTEKETSNTPVKSDY
ncbi:C-C chemokine receptor type 1 [Pseudochaenichthys georgianus]|uniref:C-C chemokine receptor type 1 n=1 Tax=Pseudochaenichthys georgianus TaxID=52239 RepID=UPI0039C2AF05